MCARAGGAGRESGERCEGCRGPLSLPSFPPFLSRPVQSGGGPPAASLRALPSIARGREGTLTGDTTQTPMHVGQGLQLQFMIRAAGGGLQRNLPIIRPRHRSTSGQAWLVAERRCVARLLWGRPRRENFEGELEGWWREGVLSATQCDYKRLLNAGPACGTFLDTRSRARYG